MNNSDLISELKKGLPLKNGNFRLPCWELYKSTSGFFCVFDHNGSKKFINLEIKRHLDAVVFLKKNEIHYFEYPDVYIKTVLFEKSKAIESLKQQTVAHSEERYWLTQAMNNDWK